MNARRPVAAPSDGGAARRAEILARVRANQPTAGPSPPLPVYDRALQVPLDTFAANLERMGGELVAVPDEGDLEDWIRRRYPQARVVCSATPDVAGTRSIASVSAPCDLADVDVGISGSMRSASWHSTWSFCWTRRRSCRTCTTPTAIHVFETRVTRCC